MSGQPLDETAIRALASSESFERGRDYWRRGTVSTLVKRGNDLAAEVEGSDVAPYRVTVQLHDRGIAGVRCTCPYEWGGSCKHIVAALLKLANEPDAVAELPPLRDLLKALDRDQLVDLLVRRLDSDPDLAGWIEAEMATAPRQDRQTAVNPEPIAARARAVLVGRYRQRRYWDDYRSSGDAAELQDLVEKAVPFLEAGDGRNALRILEAVTDVFVEEWIEHASGSDEHLYELFTDLGRMLAEAALMSDLSAEERDGLVTTVSDWQDQLADYGVDEGFDVAVRALETGWDDPALQAVLEGEAGTWPVSGGEDWVERELTAVRLRALDACDRTEAYLNLARAADARTSVAAMLVKLDRTPEAIAYARETFVLPGEAFDLSKVLQTTGRHEEALGIAEAGLRLGCDVLDDEGWLPGRSVVSLAHWLRDHAGAMGRRDLALTAARTAFEHTCSLEDYRATEAWAGEDWPIIRKDLLAHLAAARYAPDKVEVYLNEGLIDDAVRSVAADGGNTTSDAVLMRLMEAAHTSHCDWVIRLAERKAIGIMEAGAAGSYHLAAEWLERAALAYDAAGRVDEWTVTIERLIDKHHRKYKLRPLLEALRYGR